MCTASNEVDKIIITTIISENLYSVIPQQKSKLTALNKIPKEKDIECKKC